MAENRINRLRKEAGLNQKELGAKLGMAQTTISAWETGKNEPDNESMHKMSKLFHVSIGYLMGYEKSRYASLTKTELEQFDKETQEMFEKKMEEQQENEEPDELYEEIYGEPLYYEWQETDQTTYFEFFKLNKLGDYLTEAQRKRILDVAKTMFPNAVKGEYTDEVAHK